MKNRKEVALWYVQRTMRAARRLSVRSGVLRGACLVLAQLLSVVFLSRGAGAQNDDWVKKPQPDLTTTKPSGAVTLTPSPSGTALPPVASGGKIVKPSTPSSSSASASASAGASAIPGPTDDPPTPAASASAAATEAGFDRFERRKIPAGVGDIGISLKLPADWEELDNDSLPEVEPSSEATVVLRKGFGVHSPKAKPPVIHEVIVVCGKASGDYWGDNIRDAAFTQMIGGIEKETKKFTNLSSIEPEPIRAVGERFEQPFAADGEFAVDGKAAVLSKGKVRTSKTVKLLGLSFIGFHGDEKSKAIVACSIACAHLVSDGPSVCPSIVGSIEIAGAFTPAPKRSFIAELVFSLKKDPTTMWLVIIGTVFGLLVLVGLLVLLFRKKPKPALTGVHDVVDEDEHEGFDAGYQAGLAAAQATVNAPIPSNSPPSAEALQPTAPPPEGYYDPITLAPRT